MPLVVRQKYSCMKREFLCRSMGCSTEVMSLQCTVELQGLSWLASMDRGPGLCWLQSRAYRRSGLSLGSLLQAACASPMSRFLQLLARISQAQIVAPTI